MCKMQFHRNFMKYGRRFNYQCLLSTAFMEVLPLVMRYKITLSLKCGIMRSDKAKCKYKLSILRPLNGQFYLNPLERLSFADKMLKKPCNR